MSQSESVRPPLASASPSLFTDVKAGFFVFLIALPLCLAIAQASKFPPIAGVITAIVGGLLATPLGSARLTIKGPAAGLIVIVMGAVDELGIITPATETTAAVVDYAVGYHRTLAVGVVAAGIQVLFALLRLATVGATISPSVVHGMMAAIGITIGAKQIHSAMGVTAAGAPVSLIAQIPTSLGKANAAASLIGALSILILVLWPLFKQVAKRLPAQLIVLLVSVGLGLALQLGVDGQHAFAGMHYQGDHRFLVDVPQTLRELGNAIVQPDFAVVFSGPSIKWIVMFALVGFIESVLSTLAVDSLDPAKRPSDLNRDLRALGVANLVSAGLGGLPMISEIVRSKANIDAGAQSSKANFAHGAFLLLAILLVPKYLDMIPNAALAAMLIMVGWRLGGPKVWIHAWHTGWDQFLMFAVTVAVTLTTDLLKGVGAGLVVKVLLHLLRGVKFGHFFGTRIETVKAGDVLTLRLHGSAIFSTLLRVGAELHKVDASVHRVVVDLRECRLVDHTFLSRVKGIADEWQHAKLEFVMGDRLRPASTDPLAALWERR